MPVGQFKVLSEAIEAMANGALGDLDGVSVSAVLLTSAYSPDLEAHATWADYSAAELTGGGYARQAVTGLSLIDIAGGVRFDSNDITFGNPVTIPPCKYFALVIGMTGALTGTSKVIGFCDLDTTSGAATVSSTNAEFTVQAPASGWFEFTRQ